jgi:nitrite reductase/ring-hydroxylating ferredoxin subunit
MTPESLPRAALYRRTVGASLERVWENVLDWEHLPWLHRTTFCDIKLAERGSWGWRARVGLQPAHDRREILLEVRLDRPALRYVTRTLEGPGREVEIWTRLEPDGEGRTRIEVEFLVPGLDPSHAESVGAAYTRLYARLWDEDEAMMVRREELASGPRATLGTAVAPLPLGPLEEVRTRLPLLVEMGGRPFRVVSVNGELVAHSTVCPHMLGPLDLAEIEAGCIRCPWHGYRYDVRSGASSDGRGLRLGSAPRVEVDARTTEVRLLWRGER